MNLVKREVSFAHSLPLNIVIIVVGWIYFAAWTVSFYPQVPKTGCSCIHIRGGSRIYQRGVLTSRMCAKRA